MEPALYLIPVTLGDTPHSQVLPDYNTEFSEKGGSGHQYR